MKRIIYPALALIMFIGNSVWAGQQNSKITPSGSNDNPLWMRYSAISPNGSTIAFTYKGDIYTVPTTGGRASIITTNPAYDTQPIWSKDGKSIAFASDRMGSMDVYLVSSEGGTPTRLTTHSVNETPIAFIDNETILFSANILPSAESSQFPSGQFSQIYAISVKGALENSNYVAQRPVMYSTLPMEYISFSNDGKTLLYNDKKGYEDPWRKHHTSSITRDIWLCTAPSNTGIQPAKAGTYSKVTTFKGEDRNPVLAPDGKSFYFLSEQDGTFNVYKGELGVNNSFKQVTNFKGNPVRFLSLANNGTLCFGYDGEIYTLKDENGKISTPQKVDIKIISDKIDRDLVKQVVTRGADDMAVSKDGKQIAFIYHGDVYVTSSEYKTTKQITNTPQQERNIDFAPDGRSIVYSSERNGLWQVYQATIVNKDEKLFPYSSEIKEERLTNSNVASFQPLYSPNGKEVAFLENRTAIRVLNLASKTVRTVMDAKYEYSYSDGDQWYQWSPDSKWILSNSITTGGWNNKDVVLLDASGNGVMHNLTKSGYNDIMAKWVLDGKAMIWASDRAGYRSHGSWGAENDIYIMFFNLEAYEKFRMSKEDLALLEEADKEKDKTKKEEETKKTEETKKVKDAKSIKEDANVKPLTFDLENAEYRIIRLTPNSSNLGDAVLSPKGDKLYYLASFEDDMDLWEHNINDNSTKILIKGLGNASLTIDKEGKNIYVNSKDGFKKIAIEGGKTTPIPYEATFEYKPYMEREYIFDHAWQQVTDKFYDPTIRGIDWANYKSTYAKFLPYINNNYDFAEMLGEMLGELNGSHTGARYSARGNVLPTASLGIFVDDSYTGNGLKIKEIIKKSPLDVITTNTTAGCIIEKIDGKEIKVGEDYYPLLEGKSGKKVLLAIYNPTTGKRFNETVKAIGKGEENGLLYQRWVKRCRDTVEKLSGGKIGYIHIKGMDSPSFRTLYSELLGRNRDKEAVVIDTRHNGGGWLHDDVVTLLGGKEYQKFMPRGQFIGKDPYNKWTKPSCMLICEDNYSNAHGTPWVYKTLGIGKLIGAPVPGTMTAVWWETQIDPSLVFGIPQIGCMDMNGKYLENVELEPDILILNKPQEVMNGKDMQLEKAVMSLMGK
ncbi:MAG: S41 family peptidase [Bacteroidales bacterium]